MSEATPAVTPESRLANIHALADRIFYTALGIGTGSGLLIVAAFATRSPGTFWSAVVGFFTTGSMAVMGTKFSKLSKP